MGVHRRRLLIGVVAIATMVVSCAPIVRVSVDSAGDEGNSGSGGPSVSADGTVVAFTSTASDLVANDTNGVADIFVHNRTTGVTTRVSVDSAGSQANGASVDPQISGDGNIVVFVSMANNLVDDDNNHVEDVFVRDLTADKTGRVSVTTAGDELTARSDQPSISLDGRYVAFRSLATELPGDPEISDVFRRDRTLKVTELVSAPSNSTLFFSGYRNPSISDDGHYIAFEGYEDNTWVLGRDMTATASATIECCTETLVPGTAKLSGDARFVLWQTDSYQPMRREIATGEDVAVASENTNATQTAISRDGRYVAFTTLEPLITSDGNEVDDVYVRDIDTQRLARVSESRTSVEGNGPSGTGDIDITADGREIAFASDASNLVGDDTNAVGDVFVRVNPLTPAPAPS